MCQQCQTYYDSLPHANPSEGQGIFSHEFGGYSFPPGHDAPTGVLQDAYQGWGIPWWLWRREWSRITSSHRRIVHWYRSSCTPVTGAGRLYWGVFTRKFVVPMWTMFQGSMISSIRWSVLGCWWTYPRVNWRRIYWAIIYVYTRGGGGLILAMCSTVWVN